MPTLMTYLADTRSTPEQPADRSDKVHTWRPSRPYRWAIIAGVLLLAAAPAVFGLSLIKDWRYAPVFPLFLIAFGPVTVLSVFVALTPFLEGWWLRRQRIVGRGTGPAAPCLTRDLALLAHDPLRNPARSARVQRYRHHGWKASHLRQNR